MSQLTAVTDGNTSLATDVNQYRQLFRGNYLYDVKNGYGAIGDGATDDTAAIQAAFTDAAANGGRVHIPAGTYKVTSTITVTPGGAAFYMAVHGDAYQSIISWAGSASSSVFLMKGWKTGRCEGVTVRTGNIASVTCWDLDVNATQTSVGFVTFANCNVEFGTGGTGVGWRGGISTTGPGDVSFVNFENCLAIGQAYTYGDIGWQALRNNALVWNWYGGAGYNVKHIFSNARPGGGESGGGSMCFYGTGSSGNDVDFNFVNGASYLIAGGRYELGRRFATLGAAGNTVALTAQVVGVEIGAYTPTDGILFALNQATQLSVENCVIRKDASADYTVSLFTLDAVTDHAVSLSVRNSVVQAADPFYTVSGSTGPMRIIIENVGKQNTADYGTLTFFSNYGLPSDLYIGPYDPRYSTGNQGITANAGYYHAFQVKKAVKVTNAHCIPGVSAGNISLAIYSGVGTALTRVATTGGVACPAINVTATVALTAGVWLVPGVQYYAALAGSNGTASFQGHTSTGNSYIGSQSLLLAHAQGAADYPAPASVTLNTTAGAINHHLIWFD